MAEESANPSPEDAPELRKEFPTTAGRSARTPAKHQLMDGIFSQEIGVLSTRKFDDVPGAFWVDLTAGDGVAGSDEGPWRKNCSPGILAYHAKFAGNKKPVRVELFEKAPRNFAHLLGVLESELPPLGYVRLANNEWCAREGLTLFRVNNASSSTFDPNTITEDWAVQVVNDPNSINSWAMDPRLLAVIKGRTWACLGMSTMGCNVGGTKRLSREERDVWYHHVRAQAKGLHQYHDLFLAAIERDASQWAYLITAPKKWRLRVAALADEAFQKRDFSLEKYWLHVDIDGFRSLLDRLFLTNDERDAA